MAHNDLDGLRSNGEQSNPNELDTTGVEDADEALFEELAPKGNFEMEDMNILVRAVNELLPAFGQEPTYPNFEEGVQVFPTDFVRILAMVGGAVDEAIKQRAIDPGLAIDLATVTDSPGLSGLTARISELAQNQDFLRFLEQASPDSPEQPEQVSTPEAPTGPSDADVNQLFKSRIAQ